MDNKLIEQARAWLQRSVLNGGKELPSWADYKKLVEQQLSDPFNVPFQLPKEYQYVYLRAKGLSQEDALTQMGLAMTAMGQRTAGKADPWWKFW